MRKRIENSTPKDQGQKIKNADLIREKQIQICRAAEQLFAEKGYHKTSMRDIARKSRISIGSIYDYISNKEDILYLMSQQFLPDLRTEISKIIQSGYEVEQALKAFIETMLSVVERYQEYIMITYRDSKYLKKEHLKTIIEQEAFFTDAFTELVHRGKEEGLYHIQEPAIVSNLVLIMTHSWVLKRYNLKSYPFFIFKKVLMDLVFNGLLKKTALDPMTVSSGLDAVNLEPSP